MSSRYEHLKREEYDLPRDVKGIVALVQQVLSMDGPVHKIVLESGRGALVYRQLPEGEIAEEDLSIDGALRNSEIIEYDNDGASPFEKIHDMFRIVSDDGLHPVCWVTGINREDLLNQWFSNEERGLGNAKQDSLLGIPVERVSTLPEDTLILCGAPYEDSAYKDVVVGVRTSVEVFDDEDEADSPVGEIDHRVGNGPEADAPAARGMAPTSGNGDDAGWYPKDLFGIRMGER